MQVVLNSAGSPAVKSQVAVVGTAEGRDQAPAGGAQWTEHRFIPSQGTSLGCGLGPQWGAHERQPHVDVSLSPFLPLSLKINIF